LTEIVLKGPETLRALVLEKVRELALREVDLPTLPGPDDVLIDVGTVGICGSDVHYYTNRPMG